MQGLASKGHNSKYPTKRLLSISQIKIALWEFSTHAFSLCWISKALDSSLIGMRSIIILCCAVQSGRSFRWSAGSSLRYHHSIIGASSEKRAGRLYRPVRPNFLFQTSCCPVLSCLYCFPFLYHNETTFHQSVCIQHFNYFKFHTLC